MFSDGRKDGFQKVVEHSGLWVWEIDLEGKFTYSNSLATKILGYSPDELIGKKCFYDLFHPESRIVLEKSARRIIARAEPFQRLLNHYVHKDGTPVWVLTNGYPLLNEQEQIVGIRGADLDITEFKQAASEKLTILNKAVEASGEVIFLTTEAGIFTYVNPEFSRVYGYSPEEVIGKTTPRILKSGQFEPEFYKKFWRSLTLKQVVYQEFVNQTRDGEKINIESSVNPVLNENGEILGYLAIQRDITERKRIEASLLNRTKQLEALREVGLAIAGELDLNTLLEKIVDKAVSLLGGKAGGLYLVNEEKNVLECLVSSGHNRSIIGAQIQPGKGISGKVWETGESVLVNDFQAMNEIGEESINFEWSAIVGVPLVSGEKFLGVLDVYAASPRSFSESDAGLLGLFATQASIAIYNAHLHDQVQFLAITDSLTGMYNRRHFLELAEVEFERAKRYRRSLTAIMIDLDRFKSVNDTMGHLAGDMVLREIGACCLKSIREADLLGRFGGDEFIVLLPESNAISARLLAGRIRLCVANLALTYGGELIKVTMSLGIAQLEDDMNDIMELINKADAALYQAKKAGGNRVDG